MNIHDALWYANQYKEMNKEGDPLEEAQIVAVTLGDSIKYYQDELQKANLEIERLQAELAETKLELEKLEDWG